MNPSTPPILRAVKKVFRSLGLELTRWPLPPPPVLPYDPFPIYDQDSLRTPHNHDFMKEPGFLAAWQAGMDCLQDDDNLLQNGPRYFPHWRFHVALWAGSIAKNLPGDFVECGVFRGMQTSSIMQYIDWNSLDKNYYGFDTFCGLDEKYLSDEEKNDGRLNHNKTYYFRDSYETALDNFSRWDRVKLIRGSVPETLTQVCNKISFLAIDMNNAAPEIAATNYFWDSIVPGGIILLDDYAYVGYPVQKRAFDEFAREKKIEILSIPTGQGLIIKT